MLKSKHHLTILGSLLVFGLALAAPAAQAGGWLHTSGNKIYTQSGQVWMGVGANMHDTRSCNACTWGAPNVDEVKRRIDVLVDEWGANFIRLDLESYGSSSVLTDSSYLNDVREIVDHIGTKQGVYVLLSLWIDPSFSDLGWPTAGTRDVWRRLAQTFADYPYVMYGLVNEPEHNYDGAHNQAVWRAMNDTVAAIRDVEDSMGARRHIIAVQGVGGWSRFLGYYVNNPITAGGGENIAYEVHIYDPQSSFNERFINPSHTLPVIIGEYGPMHGMSMNDCRVLQERAFELKVPTLAWTFHMRCPPNLIVDNSNNGCGVGMNIQATPWGQLLKDHLANVRPFLDSLDTSGTGSTPAPVPPLVPVDPIIPGDGSDYDPAFRLGGNNNEWWVEAFANADRVELERSGGGRVAMPATTWSSFAANTNVARGASVRLHFALGAARASTEWFRFLVDTDPALHVEEEEEPVAPVEPVVPVVPDPVDPVEPEQPGAQLELRVGPNVNEWWVEVYTNANEIRVQVADGRTLSLLPTGWGSFAVSAHIARGTNVRIHASLGGVTHTSTWFQWLRGAPSFEGTPSARVYDPRPAVHPRASASWPAFTADADTVEGQLENGRRFSFSRQRASSTFVSQRTPLRRGTRMRLLFEKDGQQAETAYFRYLVDRPTLR